jgi:hypothetical protein
MKKAILLTTLILGLVFFTVPAWALILDFDTPFSDKPFPDGEAPWLTAIFTTVSPGEVELKLEADLALGNFISDVYFNLDPNLDVSLLEFSAPTIISGDITPPSISTGEDSLKADGDGYYDFAIEFLQGNSEPPYRFDDLDVLLFTITSSSQDIVAESFDFLSVQSGGEGVWQAAAHVQGLGSDNQNSTWIGPGDGFHPIPEPATMLLFASGLLGLAGFGRKVRKRQFKIPS